MFCYQCEQTDRTPAADDNRRGLPIVGLAGCATARGVCGKEPTTADLQDLLLYAVEGLSQYSTRARRSG